MLSMENTGREEYMAPNHNKHKDQTGKRRRISFITSGHENDQMVYSGTWVCQLDKCKHPNRSSGRRDQCAMAITGRRRWDGAEVCMRVCACAWGGGKCARSREQEQPRDWSQ